MQLDGQLRKYPDFIQSSDASEAVAEDQSPGRAIRRAFTSALKEVCLLHLHTRFFGIALRDAPKDPLKSQFAPSVLACHRSAARYLSVCIATYNAQPTIALRICIVWPHLFVATLVLGSIVARSPSCSLASPALGDLEKACQMWEAASGNICGPNVLATVRKLRNKAFTAFAQSNTLNHPHGVAPREVEVEDEILALGGAGPRMVSSTLRPSNLPHPSSYPPEHAASDIPSRDLSSTSTSEGYAAMRTSMQEVHKPEYPSFEGFFPDSSTLPMEPPFDFTNVDSNLSSHIPEVMASTLPSDFDFFQNTARTTPSASVGSSVLDELGLGGEWKPVMDGLEL